MREFLLDKKIVGMFLVSRCNGILHHTIPEIMKLVDYLVIVFDFPDESTRKIVEEYKVKYGNIQTYESGIPNHIGTRNKHYFQNTENGMFKRFNALQGEIRESAFNVIKKKIKGGEVIDILIWLDSDEMAAGSMREILTDFANNDKKKALLMRSFEVFNDYHHILPPSMNAHTRVLKPSLDMHIMPYAGLARVWGITKPEKQRYLNSYIHCYMLTKEKREWRSRHWKSRDKETYLKLPLWKTKKDARELTMQEVEDIFKEPADTTIGKYLINNNLEI